MNLPLTNLFKTPAKCDRSICNVIFNTKRYFKAEAKELKLVLATDPLFRAHVHKHLEESMENEGAVEVTITISNNERKKKFSVSL